MAQKFTTRNLQLETNPKFADDDKYTAFINMGGGPVKIMVFGPGKPEDYWHFRVQVHEDQWLEAFPKFMTIGIGFAKEDDENANLPASCGTKTIFNHIKHNKRYASISNEVCLKAIYMLQEAALEYEAFQRMLEAQEMACLEPMLVNKDQTDFVSHREFKQNAVIKRARNKTTFVRTVDRAEYNLTAYNVYFGKISDGIYKYKIQSYAFNEKQAIQKSKVIIRHLATTNEKKVHTVNDFIGEVGAFETKEKVDNMFF